MSLLNQDTVSQSWTEFQSEMKVDAIATKIQNAISLYQQGMWSAEIFAIVIKQNSEKLIEEIFHNG